MTKFKLHTGDNYNVPCSENYVVYKWHKENVVFSIAQMGESLNVHLAADKQGAKHLLPACKDFKQFCFDNFNWCKRLIALIKMKRLKSVVEKIGFKYVTEVKGHSYYVLDKENI